MLAVELTKSLDDVLAELLDDVLTESLGDVLIEVPLSGRGRA